MPGAFFKQQGRMQGLLRPCIAALALVLLPALSHAQEICDNGLIDLNDTLACPCSLLPPPSNLISNGSFEQHNCCPNQNPSWPMANQQVHSTP